MKTIRTPIIPTHQQLVAIDAPAEPDKKAICIFAAAGFFLETDTYWKNKKALPPATVNTIDENGFWTASKPWFEWYYKPRDISFETALEEFTGLFEKIVAEQAGDRPVLLPLSGGLDSRTQAVAASKLSNPVLAYSYSFKNGYPESKIGKKIAAVYDFPFREFTIEPGYLWPKIEDLAAINQCYSDFTHPRQMAVLEDFKKMDGVFSLGHWGDVLFDRGADKGTGPEEILPQLKKRIVKKGGLELANALWETWDLDGDFESYLDSRIEKMLRTIKIDNVSAKVRAFKTMSWAPRWTTVNMALFEEAHPYALPYYDDRMCRFICEIPEEYLADRKLQIEYIKQQSPELAKITWQAQKPFNLYTYKKNKIPYNLPYRIFSKARRSLRSRFGKPYIQRNWELQFLGMENDLQLQAWLFDENLHPFLPKPLLARFYNSFKTTDPVTYSHPLSMLLTLAVWYRKQKSADFQIQNSGEKN